MATVRHRTNGRRPRPRVTLEGFGREDEERIRSALEHAGVDPSSVQSGREEPIRVGRLCVSAASHTAYLDDEELVLTALEFGLLAALARRADSFVPRTELMAEVWGDPGKAGRTLDIHVRRLRAKLGPLGAGIETRVRVGYRLAWAAFA